MGQRPTVTAQARHERQTASTLQGPSRSTPGVQIEVTFDLHDHEAALRLLHRAVRDVEDQIRETDV